jgi:muramidase (phage lysozyme)
MKKAFASGKYSEATFYNKMGTWSKEMRVRYPQYKEVIDQQLGRVMGRTPANLEMDAVRTQMEAEMSSQGKAADDKQKFIDKNKGVLTPEEEVELLTSTNPEVTNRLMLKGTLLSSDRVRLEYETKQLEQDVKAGALEAAPVVSQLASNIERQVYLGAIGKGGGTLQSLRNEINRMREGGFSPEETERANGMIQEAIASVDQAWIAGTTTPNASGKALADYFASDPTAWNAQKAKIEAIKQDLGGLLTGKAGVFEWNATKQAALTNVRMQKLEDALGSDFVDGLKAIESLVGTENMNTIYGSISQSEGKDPITDYMTGLIVGKTVKEGDIGVSITEVLKSVDPAHRAQANKSARGAVEALVKTASDTNLPIEARHKAALAVYTDTDNKFFRTLKDTPDNTGRSSREKAFLRLSSPEQEAMMKELGLQKEYTNWVKTTSPALMATVVEEVNATNVNTKYVDIRVNPNTLQAEVTLNKKLVKDPAKLAKWLQQASSGRPMSMSDVPGDIPIEDLTQLKVGLDAVQKLNMINGALARALKSENPGMTNVDLGKALTQYMGNLQSTYTKAEPWTTKFYESLKNADWFATEAQKQWEKDQTGEDFGIVPGGDTNFNVQEDSLSSLGDDDAAAILGFVSKAEGADFNTLFGGSKVILEEKTVAEVQQMQRAHGKKTGSSATGAYQVMRKTLSDLIDQGVVDPDEPFTEDVQNRIGMALLERRGYADWKSGKLSTEQFADRLAQEWAALPLGSGKSAHEGKMGNKARVPRAELVAMLEGLKA